MISVSSLRRSVVRSNNASGKTSSVLDARDDPCRDVVARTDRHVEGQGHGGSAVEALGRHRGSVMLARRTDASLTVGTSTNASASGPQRTGRTARGPLRRIPSSAQWTTFAELFAGEGTAAAGSAAAPADGGACVVRLQSCILYVVTLPPEVTSSMHRVTKSSPPFPQRTSVTNGPSVPPQPLTRETRAKANAQRNLRGFIWGTLLSLPSEEES